MKGRKRAIRFGCLLLLGLLGLCSCSSPSSDSGQEQQEDKKESQGLIYQDSENLQYAENFSIDYYEGGYTVLSIKDGGRWLVVPEGKEIPADLEEDMMVLQRPVQNLYLVASAAMDMFVSLDALESIRFSGQKAENWYIDPARAAMERGEILYAGKYSKPDYELIVSENCTLAIENKMILHAPEVIEMLESFGIPVMIEQSSYESHPLGRVEWVKFWGALTGKEEQARELFDRQKAIVDQVTAEEKTDKTVAFFYITSNGLVQVRQSSDYVPKMIELAGGRYIFPDLVEDGAKRSTMNMQVEEFYNGAKNADYLIYNSSIDGGVSTVEELIDKCEVLKDFKAVREGHVFCTTNDMYQQSMAIGDMIADIHSMLSDDGKAEMNYIFPLE